MSLHLLFFYITILLLPTQLGLHFWPEWSFIVGRRIDYLAPTFFLTDITVFFIFLSLLIQTKLRIIQHVWKNKIMVLSLGGLVIFACINSFLATSPQAALFAWLKVLESLFISWYIIRIKPSLPASLSLFSIAIIYSSSIALAQSILQHSINGLLWFIGERSFTLSTPGIAKTYLDFSFVPFLSQISRLPSQLTLRPYATFPHPNVLGGFIAVILPLIITNKVTSKRYIFLRYSASILGFVALVLTFSKTAIIAFCIGLFLLTLKAYRSRKISIIMIACIFLVLLGAYIKFSSTTTLEESIEDRVSLQTSAMKIFTLSPIIGVGLNNFLIHLPEVTTARKIFFIQPVHSVYILLISEIGIVGVLLLLVAVTKFILLWKNKKNDRMTFILGIACTEILFLGLFDHYLLTTQQGRLLMSVIFGFFLSHLIRKTK